MRFQGFVDRSFHRCSIWYGDSHTVAIFTELVPAFARPRSENRSRSCTRWARSKNALVAGTSHRGHFFLPFFGNDRRSALISSAEIQ